MGHHPAFPGGSSRGEVGAGLKRTGQSGFLFSKTSHAFDPKQGHIIHELRIARDFNKQPRQLNIERECLSGLSCQRENRFVPFAVQDAKPGGYPAAQAADRARPVDLTQRRAHHAEEALGVDDFTAKGDAADLLCGDA